MKRVTIDDQRLRLPVGLRARKMPSGKLYFYLTLTSTVKEISVGCDYKKAIELWKMDRCDDASKSMQLANFAGLQFRWVANEYQLRVTSVRPVKAQAIEHRLIQRLIKQWEEHQLDDITPQQVEKWFLQRLSISPIRARLEKSLLTHMWNWARKQGYAVSVMPVISSTALESSQFYQTDEIVKRLLKRDTEFSAVCKSVSFGELFKHQPAKLVFEKVRAAEVAELVIQKRPDLSSVVQKFKWGQFCDRLIYCW